jgi:hypothetical protein
LRQRLVARRNFELVTALDETRVLRVATRTERTGWPDGWEFTASLDEDESRFALTNGDGAVRLAIGVSEAVTDAKDVHIDQTGVVWKDLELEQPDPQGERSLSQRWIQWKRAEHHAVRSALSGIAWRLTHVDGEWRLEGGAAYGDLPGALKAVPSAIDGQPQPPGVPARSSSPRNGYAYDRLVRRAIDTGLLRIEADPTTGLTATFEDGDRAEGPTLSDILTRTA